MHSQVSHAIAEKDRLLHYWGLFEKHRYRDSWKSVVQDRVNSLCDLIVANVNSPDGLLSCARKIALRVCINSFNMSREVDLSGDELFKSYAIFGHQRLSRRGLFVFGGC